MDADVLIIGAGPSGSVAARMLKKLGYHVLILEKELFPRFSIGESLLPHCMKFLEDADLLERVAAENFQLKNGAAFSYAGKLTEFDFSQKFTPGWATTYQVPRARFDQILAEAAEDCGAPIHYQHSIVAADFNTPGQARLTSIDANGLQRDWTASLAVPLVDRQLRGFPVDWQTSYEQVLRNGINVFRAYVDAWYDGRFQRLIFEERQLVNIKAMICSILAGFVWDEANPMTQRCGKKIEAIAESCPPL